MKSWRRTKAYRRWRVGVIRRDKRCIVCSSIKKREAHHLASVEYHKELRFELDNGVTLCRKCHTQFHCNYKKSFRQKTTADDFENFMELIKYIKLLPRY